MDITFGFWDATTNKGIPNASGSITQISNGNVVASYPVDQVVVIHGIDFSPNTNYQFDISGYKEVTKSGQDLSDYTTQNANGDLNPIMILTLTQKNNITTLALLGAGLLFIIPSDSKKKHDVIGKLQTKDVVPYIVIAGGLLAFGFLNKIITGIENLFGLSKSQSQTGVENIENTPGSYWAPAFWKKYSSYPNSSVVNDDIKAGQIVYTIDNAFGILSDDFAQVEGAFKQMTSQSDLSYIADRINQVYNTDFITYLQGTSWPNDRLSDDQILQLNSYISNLPTN